MKYFGATALLAASLSTGPAAALPPLEAYGGLPQIDHMAISPDGESFAYLLRGEDAEGVIAFSVAEGVIGGVKIDKGKVRRLSFPTKDHVIIQASTLSTAQYTSNDFEFSTAHSYNIRTKSLKPMFPAATNYQSGFGSYIGVTSDRKRLLMPSYLGREFGVVEVDLDSGRAVDAHTAGQEAVGWVFSSSGAILAREDFSRYDKEYNVRTARNGAWERVYYVRVDEPPFRLVGSRADESALLAYEEDGPAGYATLRQLSFSGEVSEPLFPRKDSDINDVLSDVNLHVLGVEFAGLQPVTNFSIRR